MLRYIRCLFLLSACSILPLFAQELSCKAQKTYVQLNDLVFHESGMLFACPIQSVQHGLTTLRHDAQGFYYCANSEDEYWICVGCGRSNPGRYYGQLCPKCSWPVWDNKQ